MNLEQNKNGKNRIWEKTEFRKKFKQKKQNLRKNRI